jgi:hypothetical protein
MVMIHSKRHWLVSAGAMTLAALLSSLPAALPDDSTATTRAKVAEFRAKDSQGYALVYHNAKAFLALPAVRQKAIRDLHKELQDQPSIQKLRLTEVMKRYVEWLDSLPQEDQKRIDQAPDRTTRLRIIREIRDKEWLSRQPKAIRDAVDNLANRKPVPVVSQAGALGLGMHLAATLLEPAKLDALTETIKQLKQQQAQKARDWLIATRFWDELIHPQKKPPMPVRAVDFSPHIDLFVREYLRPMLSSAEQKRLDDAEGHWPQYPMTLVELADKHPIALPPKDGPTKYDELPSDIKKRMDRLFELKTVKKGKQPDFVLRNNPKLKKEIDARLAEIGDASLATKFIMAVVTHAHNNFVKLVDDKVQFHEVWPTKYSELWVDMQVFLKLFSKRLSPTEAAELKMAENKWPEYVLKIKELAARYNERPPWQTLPDAEKHQWDKYRLQPRQKAEAPRKLPGAEFFAEDMVMVELLPALLSAEKQ